MYINVPRKPFICVSCFCQPTREIPVQSLSMTSPRYLLLLRYHLQFVCLSVHHLCSDTTEPIGIFILAHSSTLTIANRHGLIELSETKTSPSHRQLPKTMRFYKNDHTIQHFPESTGSIFKLFDLICFFNDRLFFSIFFSSHMTSLKTGKQLVG